ncbi:N-acetylmuramoyl-L-alanine amidase [Paenibacillus oceani]|uniref:N-acetylmuramoyl-L-alanine amidase n=1 Tax=Paenibacillus oceani TaxID=2772510 RepID=A0A927GZY4_9BACL|nr:peptidoglycan recognition family protein [Paenibacillus oceani]MBD2863135.1 N-acetylmuramoyl-L-alanine amidase [Paenibacillus oceani]
MNPNKYSISIEHEGTDGNLTEEQYQATLWLHRYIRDYVKDKWGYEIGLTTYDVIGHFQVSPYKPLCPGKYFPWERLYNDLQKGDETMLNPDVANNIIDSYLSPQWFHCDEEMDKAEAEGRLESAEAWKNQRDWQKYLADELRRASGIVE